MNLRPVLLACPLLIAGACTDKDTNEEEDDTGQILDTGGGEDTSTDCEDDDAQTWYADSDADGFGDDADTLSACEQPEGYVESSSDCDDSDPEQHPDADEYCNGEDDDCDAEIDEAGALDETSWYPDLDGDGFGGAADPVLACDPPSNHVDDSSDCDDAHDYIYPGAVELCDGMDTDCDASTGEEGTVLLEDASGQLWDLTADFETDVSDPVRIELDSDGGVYWFCEGTYGAILEVSASVDIRGRAGDFTTTGFYGNDEETVLSVVGDGLEVTLQDLFITAGLGSGTLSFGESEIAESGGGIWCTGSNSLSLERVSIWDNYGIIGGGIASDGCDLTLTDSTVFDNTAWIGGGLMMVDADLTLNTTEITTNSAAADGSAIYQYAASTDLSFSMSDSLIHDNASDVSGDGTVYLHSEAGAIDALCTGDASIQAGIIDNDAGDTAALVLHDEGTGLVFESAGCDWGTEKDRQH